MSKTAAEVENHIRDTVDSIPDEEMQAMTNDDARTASIEAFLNIMMQHEDDEDYENILNNIAFRTLTIVAFGTMRVNDPSHFTDYILDCMMVAPTDKTRMAIRFNAGAMMKALILTFGGKDVITPIMSSFVDEAEGATDEEHAEAVEALKKEMGKAVGEDEC